MNRSITLKDKIDALLAELQAREIRLWVEDGGLRYSAPSGAFSDDLRRQIGDIRAALIAHLNRDAAPTPAQGVQRQPLSFGQERMWFLNRLEMAQRAGGSADAAPGFYTEHLAFAIAGAIDESALRHAVALIAARHQGFRTRFADDDGEVVQLIHPPGDFDLVMVDLSTAPAADAEGEKRLADSAHRVIDLAQDPHVQVLLIRLAADRHLLSVSAHHAAWDGWSNGVFTAELTAAYNAFAAGQTPDLPPLPLSFADVADVQRRQLADGQLDATATARAEQLRGWPDTLPLPFDRPRTATQDPNGANIQVTVPQKTAQALTAAAKRQGATVFMAALAGWAVLLSRLSGQKRLLIGTPLAVRDPVGHDKLIGYFANTAPVAIDLEGTPTFRTVVGRVQAAVLEALGAQDVPFELLVEKLAPPRHPAQPPLVQALFALQPREVEPPALTGLQCRVLPVHNTAARYDLMLNLEVAADGSLEGPLTYATSLFDAATVTGWIGHLLTFLAEIPARWDQPVDLSPLAATPQAQAQPAVVLQATDDSATDDSAPATPTEIRLAALWKELLKAGRIGRQDDFFILGGHSLLLMRMVNRINSEGWRSNGDKLDLAQAMATTTLSAMAALIDGKATPGPDRATAAFTDFPASFGQADIWLSQRDNPDTLDYAVTFVTALPVGSDPALVRAVIERLTARHPALRTTLYEKDDHVFQRVHATGTVPLIVAPAAAGSADMIAAIRAESRRPMNLSSGPLYRFTLFAAAPGATGNGDILFGVANHAVVDGWSLDVLRTDITALYTALAQGTEPALPPLALTPAEMSRLQTERLNGPRGTELTDFWQPRLSVLAALESLPVDTPRPTDRPMDGHRTTRPMNPAAAQALTALARTGRTTQTAVWTAALTALLARMKADGSAAAVALPFAGRLEAEHEGLVGFFVNILPVGFDGNLARPFIDHLADTAAETAAVMAHQDYPIRQLINDAGRLRGNEPGLIYDAVSVVEHREAGFEWLQDDSLAAGKHELCFVLTHLDSGETLITVEHDRVAWPDARAAAMARHLEQLLISAAAAPQTPVGDLDWLSAEERRHLVDDANHTDAPYPRDASLAQLWREAVTRFADAPALVGAEGSTWSYGELDRRVTAIAGNLLHQKDGVGPAVALALPRGMEAIAAVLAVIKAGAAYLPLDDKMPPAVVAKLMADAGAHLLVADDSAAVRLRGLADDGKVRIVPLARLTPPNAGAVFPDYLGHEHPAYLMFTSGSTGEPKGVMVSHRGVARLAYDPVLAPRGPQHAMAQGAPLGFDASTYEIWAALLTGARLEILSDEEMLEPALLAARIKRSGITHAFLTSALFNRVAEAEPAAFRPLTLLATGGDALSPTHAARVLAACPDVTLINGYGPTENTVFATARCVTLADTAGNPPIGKPVANTRAYVLDDRLHPVPVGVWGELYAGGDGVALGYANRPDLTAKSFLTLPWLPQERVYKTGDRVRWQADGTLEFGGRRDGQVKIRGHRIETAAIEAVLTACPGIRNAGVIVAGSGADKALIAFVTCTPGHGAQDEGQWRRAVAEALPLYNMPAQFVVLGEIPVNANGKMDRKALRRLIPDAVTPEGETGAPDGRPPASGAEKLVARLFAELFPHSTIAADDDFFHLGGHSLMAMRFAARLTEETGKKLSMRALLTVRTVEAIAALLDRAETDATPATSAVTANVNDDADYPLSNGQERLWVIQRIHPDSAAYNIPVSFDILGTLDIDRFAQALVALETRHHALRVRVVAPSDPREAPRQRVAAPDSLAPLVIDCTGEVDPLAAATARIRQESLRPFRLEDDAPARTFLFRLGPQHWRFVLVIHHAITDGWSMGILLEDLTRLWAGEALAPLQAQFTDFARWQRNYLAGAEGQASVKRWVERLSPVPEPLALNTDRRRPPQRSLRGATYDYVFGEDVSRALSTFANRNGVTPFTVALALVHALMYRHTGQTDFALGTLVAGRDRPEFAGVAGFFVNTLALRRSIDPAAALQDHVAAMRDTVMDAIADQHCPFETLVDTLGLPRDLSRNPLFDVLVVWQETPGLAPALAGLETRPIPPEYPFAKFDLGFHFHHRDGGRDGRVAVTMEYASDLYDEASITALLARLETLAADAFARPQTPLGALNFLPADERRLVVETFNATARDLPTRGTIPQLLLEQAAKTPAAPALLAADGTVTDYATFVSRAGAVAAALAQAGVKPGDRVAVALRRSPEMMAAIHGVLMAGCAYTPLDPDQPEARLAGMLEDLGGPPVIALAEHQDVLKAAGRIIAPPPANAAVQPVSLAGPDDLAYILFTSGSTGRPKGAAIEHHSVLNRILWMHETFPIGEGDVIMQKTPVTFDVSVWELFWWSWTGAAVALPAPGTERDPTALVDAVAAHKVTVMHFVPSMLAIFLTCLEEGWADVAKLASLRLVFASGEALDPALAERFDKVLTRRFGTQLHNLYGPTEATVDVSWYPCTPWTGAETVPIGAPVANTQLYVLDPAGQPLPIGVSGEIHIGGVQVARGYVNRPELTAEKFIADPFRPGGRLYRTGDLGRWRRDGVIEYQGRIDHQVKIRGQRIEPGEIENTLESLPEVERCVVIAAYNQGMAELHAYILPAAGQNPTANDLRTYARAHLSEAMGPSRFFRLESLPLTSSGKVDRKALTGRPLERGGNTKPAAAKKKPAAVEAAKAEQAKPVAPTPPGLATPVAEMVPEAALREIWQRLLPDATPEDDEGFFEAGGNSMLLIRLHEAVEARWPGAFTVAELFAAPTIAAQAEKLRVFLKLPAPVAPAPDFPAPMVAETASATATETPVSVASNSAPGTFHAAIIGMAVRVNGADTLEAFWRDVAAGADKVRTIPESRAAAARQILASMGMDAPASFREAAYIDDLFDVDPARFRMSPADAALLDPEQRLFLDTAAGALENAGYGGHALDHQPVGVFAGACPSSNWRDAVGRVAPERAEQIFALNVPSNIANRLSYLHDWRGPAMLVDTACSSSLVAVHLAVQALARGECRYAVAGGAKAVLLPPPGDVRFSIDSSTGRTRAFDKDADGTGMGEGAVVFLLKSLAQAQADGDAIHAVIVGSAVNQDGASSGPAAPNPAAQAEVIAAAHAAAATTIDSVSYFEAHGTGTKLGDPIEIQGLTTAAAAIQQKGFALIGSAKGNYGHLDAAAGALGVARAVMALIHDQAPPQPYFTAANPAIDFAQAPVKVADALTPLPARGFGQGGAKRAGVSAFGLSGINAHLVLEAAPPQVRVVDDQPLDLWQVVGLSAGDMAGLRRYAGAVVAAMRAHPEWSLTAIAHTLIAGRDPLEARLAVWVRDRGDLMARLAVFAAAPDAVGDLVAVGHVPPRRGGHPPAGLPCACADAGQAQAGARAFVAGQARVTWPKGSEAAVGRVHLPAAPRRRQTLLPDFSDLPTRAGAVIAAGGSAVGHPVATPEGTSFAVTVHDAAFWPMSEHLLSDRPTLVGMAFPALVERAAVALRRPLPLILRNLRWLRPLTASAVAGGAATLTLARRTDDAGRFPISLGGLSADGKWLSFVEAALADTPAAAVIPALDVADLNGRFGPLSPAPAFVATSGPVAVSERWNCLRGVARRSVGEIAETLARLSLTGAADPQFPLHPGLLDVAASLPLTEPGLVPAGCDTIAVYGPLPGEVLAHAVTLKSDAEELLADITLADAETGRVALTLQGLRFLRIGGPVGGLAADHGEPALLLPVWKPAETTPAIPDGTVSVLGKGRLGDSLTAWLTANGRMAANSAVATAGLVLLIDGVGDEYLQGVVFGTLTSILKDLQRPTSLLVVGSDDPAKAPLTAFARGLVQVAAMEEPLLSTRFVTVADGVAPERVLAELPAQTAIDPARAEGHVLLTATGRLVRGLAEAATHGEPAIRWPDSGVCVITGGTGGLALAQGLWAANGGKVTLALLSRTGEPTGNDGESVRRRDALAALAAQGVRLHHVACDVTQPGLSGTLQRIRDELGPITAVIHNAGAADTGFLVKMTDQDLDAVRRIKADVAVTLRDLTRNDPLQAFVMAGSLTGLFGAPGHAGYTAANAWLDAYAHQLRGEGVPALAIDWCPLADIGMLARLQQDKPNQAAGADMLSPAQVPAVMARALASGAAQVAVFARAPKELLAGAPDRIAADDTAATGEPGSLAERLGQIWGAVLGYDSIDPDDDFYALGGDSITGMQIVERIIRELKIPTTLAALFQAGTVAALARKLETVSEPEKAAQPTGIGAAPVLAEYPLGREQESVLAAQLAMGDSDAFNLPIGITLPPDTDVARLEAALAALTARHESLRTHLLTTREPMAMAIAPPPAAVVLERLSLTDDGANDAVLRAWVRPFDFAAGPAVRFALVSDAAGRPYALLLDIHHALADAFSLEVLIGDLAAFYYGKGDTLPPAGLTPKDFAWWSRKGAGADAAQSALAYWQRQFPLPLPTLDLAADRPRPPAHSWAGGMTGFELAGETVTALRRFAQSRRVTPYTVVLAAWALLLARYAEQDEVVIAVPVDQRDIGPREGASLSRMVNMMVAMLPLRIAVKAGDSVADVVARAQAVHAQAMEHRACPLGLLLETLAPPAMPERTPLSEVSLSYMNFTQANTDGAPETAFQQFGIQRRQCKNDLSIFVRDLPDSIGVAIEYYADLFDGERIARLGRHFQTLLAALADADAGTAVRCLSLADATETALPAPAGLAVIDANGQPAAVGLWGEIVRDGVATGQRGRWAVSNGARGLDYGGPLPGHDAGSWPLATMLDGDDTLCVLVRANDPLPNVADLRETFAATAARRFIAVNALPVDGASGAIDPTRLADAAGRGLALADIAGETASGPLATANERLVAAVFAELLDEPVDDRAADFVDLGGHSLLAIRAVNRIATAAGVRLAMADFFTRPTVANIAARIDALQASGTATVQGSEAAIPRAADADTYPVSYAQRRLYLAHTMDPTGAAYTMTFAFRCSAALDRDALRRAVTALVTRHEPLRTGFTAQDGDIVQRIAAPETVEIPWAEEDVRRHTDPRGEALRLVRRIVGATFDIAVPPLVKVRLIRVGDDEWLVLVLIHHIVGDGWSSQILTAELAQLYSDPAVELPALTRSYRDFTVWQHARDWSAHAAYWRDALAGAPDTIALPADRPLPDVPSYRGGTARAALTPEVTRAVHAMARTRGVTVSALGLALLAALLFRLTRQRDMVLGLSVAGRDHAEVEGMIGFFVNVLPVRIRMDDDTEFSQLLQTVQTGVMAALERRDYPFDLLAQDLGARRTSRGGGGARRPVTNVVFEYQRFEDGAEDTGGNGGLPAAPADADHGRALYETIHTATAKHDLLLFMIERGDFIELALEYDADILDAETAEDWVDHLAHFAEILSAPAQ